MVDYRTWTALVFEVVEEAGVDLDFDGSQEVTRAASIVWTDDKKEIKAMSRREAKAHADAEISIST